jgi:hypothetical protein
MRGGVADPANQRLVLANGAIRRIGKIVGHAALPVGAVAKPQPRAQLADVADRGVQGVIVIAVLGYAEYRIGILL